MHLLLIEPNPVLANTYVIAFGHAGFSMAHAVDAQTAIDLADDKRPDVVIMELQLAVHSGIEFLHEFRSYVEWQNIPIIVNTMLPPSHMQSVGDILQRDLGIKAILYKPHTSLRQLLQAVQEHLVSV